MWQVTIQELNSPKQLTTVVLAKNSRGLDQNDPRIRFLGWFVDLSAAGIKPEVNYTLTVSIPAMAYPSDHYGFFQGVFVENVETVVTDQLQQIQCPNDAPPAPDVVADTAIEHLIPTSRSTHSLEAGRLKMTWEKM